MKIICPFKNYLRNENIQTTKVYRKAVVVQNFIENLCQSPVGKMRKLLRRHTIYIKCNEQEVEYYSSFSKFLYYSPICISTNKRDMNIFYTNILTRIVYLKWKQLCLTFSLRILLVSEIFLIVFYKISQIIQESMTGKS